MIYHRRQEWQSSTQPVTGPAMPKDAISRIVIHYPGADFTDLDFNNDGLVNGADSIVVLRQMQAQYLRKSPPYSLGYNWMIDTSGEVWEIRGFDIKCAANSEVNGSSVAIIILVDDQDAANEAQIIATRELIAQIRDWKNLKLPIVTHASVATNSTHTPCPGKGITPQVIGGVFEPVTVPPVTPGKIGKAMIIEWAPGTAYYTVFVTDFTTIAWVFDGIWSGVIQGAGLPKVTVDRTQLLSAIKSLKPTTSWPGTFHDDPELIKAWEEPRPD